jgi:hypothetical protein
MKPAPGQVLHFSEDPTIKQFVPHVAPTSNQEEAYVWAVGPERCPDYWFPRQCPRALVWIGEKTTKLDADRIIGVGCGTRVHAIEYGWLKAMQEAELYAYRLPADPFEARFENAVVATVPVKPLGPPERVEDLLGLHEQEGIQLRVMNSLWPFWDEVITSTVEFSGIRLRNARR